MLRLFAACVFAACLLAPSARAQDRTLPPLLLVQGAETPVQLQRASLAADIGGGMADTTIELVFHNPNRRVLEGELQLPLAPGQKVLGFALDIGGEMRPAVAVGKARGRQVFEEIVRRGVDPGLLETTQGDNFKLRIYPIPPGGERRVQLRIVQALARAGSEWRYRFAAPWAAGAGQWRATARIDGSESAAPSLLDGVLALQGRLETAPRAWTGDFEGDSYAVAEIPVDAAVRPRVLPKTVGLLWDSSGSGAAGEIEVRLVRLRDRAEAPRSYRVRGGDWSLLRRELEATVYDGATALGGWTADAGVGEYLLFSDGLENYGARSFPELARGQRLFAVNAATGGADSARLDALAQRHGGRAIALAADGVDAAASALLDDGLRIAALSGEGLDELQAEALDARGGLLRVAARRLQPDAALRVTLSDGRTIAIPVTPASPRQPLAPWLWAGWRIDALQADYELQRSAIGRIGKRFGIATRDTSLIVLERLDDYVRYDIPAPPGLRKAVEQMQGMVRPGRPSAAKLEAVVRELDDKLAWWQDPFPTKTPPPGSAGKASVADDVRPLPAPAPPAPPAPLAYAPAPGNTVANATSAPAPSGMFRRSAGAPAAPAPGPSIGIALRKWTPDQRYLDRMAGADGRQAYAIYLDQKPDYAASTAFYLDVADTLLGKGERALALRVLSNLAEMDLENRHVLRVLGYRLLQAGAPELAVPVFESVLRLAEEEPQSWRDLGLAYAAAGRAQQAVDTLYQVAVRDWNGRFSEIELITLADMNAIIAANRARLDTSRIDPRLLRHMPLDLRVVLSWDSDNSDMDLWVTDPDGERCLYSNRYTRIGGRLSRDNTGGYGPEEFSLRHARPGKYKVEAHFFGHGQQIVAGATTLQLKLATGFGTPRAKEKMVTLRLRGQGDSVLVGEFEVPPGR
jgi:Ca-activated chloride channel family protein